MADEKEIKQLSRLFGEFERATFEYRDISPAFGEWVKRLTRRRGEIVLVVPRGDGRVLLHTKPHYPEDIYRLPTGGIHPGEDAVIAAKRETYEEIGFKPKHLKLHGVLENVFWVNQQALVYPSFVFETEEFTRKPAPTDPGEEISGFRDAETIELRAIAHELASLPLNWSEWGKFRGAAHAWLADRRS